MRQDDISQAELGHGYKLKFQTRTGSDEVRAVVYNAQDEIVARGVIVPKAEAHRSRFDVLTGPDSHLWLVRPQPSQYDDSDSDSDGEDDGEDVEDADDGSEFID